MAVNERKRVLRDVQARSLSLGVRIQKRAVSLSLSGGADLDMDPEDLAAILFTAALLDVAEQIRRQTYGADRLRKAVENLRLFD